MNLINKIVVTLFLFVALLSCSHDGIDIFGGDKVISFSTNLIHTRANPCTEGGANDFKSMGVYSTITSNEWSAVDNVATDWDNVQVVRDNGSTGWSYTPPKAWTNERHTFFAYAPYNPPGLTINSSTPGIPAMTFTVANASSDQLDLLVAEAHYNRTDTTTGAVHLKMHHALSRIAFSAKIVNTLPDNTEIKLSKVELTHLKNSAKRPMDFRPSDLWYDHAGDQTYTLENNSSQLNGDALSQTLRAVTRPDGNLYLIPQDFTANTQTELIVTYETYVNGTKTLTNSVSKKMCDIIDGWLAGEALHFILSIPNPPHPQPFSVEVIHASWDNVDMDAAIEADPYLDITNLNVSTYDAAATRIYFYTNVPEDQVSIEPIGKINTSNGASFNLKDEFYAITSDDLDGSFNLHKPQQGKGWIDLINRNTSTAGERPNQGKYPLIIRLKAGKIIRDITVQQVISTEAAKQNSTPYVGTFHRSSETGERIVTWHLSPSKKWEATIEKIPGSDYDQLCIDRLASPDFSNNILYSFVPRESRGAEVDPLLDKVKGSGRVYFRVGWKTASVSNRYARIKVTVDGVDQYLYCRQGETEQVITNAAPSFFAVYNIGQFRQFVQYPTQVGMFYQWNDNKAWAPLGKKTPVGYTQLNHPAPFDFERSPCPEGYLLPHQTELNQMNSVLSNAWNLWGYYADGFFDRRPINNLDHRVEASSLEVASAGILFFNGTGPLTGDYTPRAIFLPTGGLRASRVNMGSFQLGELAHPGLTGGYWSSVQDASQSDFAWGGFFAMPGYTVDGNPVVSGVKSFVKDYGYSLRCVQAVDGKVWVVRFDANGGENPPASLTVSIPDPIVGITLPTTIPTNYWRDGYKFVGWTTDKANLGTLYLPGDIFVPVDSKPKVNILYAKWESI